MRRDWSGGAQRALDRHAALYCQVSTADRSCAVSPRPVEPRGIEPLPFAFLQTRRSPTELQPPARSADYGHQLTLRQARAVA